MDVYDQYEHDLPFEEAQYEHLVSAAAAFHDDDPYVVKMAVLTPVQGVNQHSVLFTWCFIM